MPGVTELTRDQERFLSKYLQPISDKFKKKKVFSKKKKREAHNVIVQQELDALKTDFSEWIEMRDAVTDKMDEIDATHDLSKVPEQEAKLENLRRRHAAIVSDVRSAPADAPKFKEGTASLRMLWGELMILDREAQVAIDAIVPPPPADLFDPSLEEIDAMARFEDHPTITESIASKALADQDADTTRKAKLRDHAKLCSDASDAVKGLQQSAASGGDAASLEKQARKAVHDLQAARRPVLNDLAAVLATSAKAKLSELAQSGDKVAEREEKRDARLQEDAQKIDTALGKIDQKIADLRNDLGTAEGFGEKRAIKSEIGAEEDRREALDGRARQMEFYNASAARHLDAILSAEDSRKAMDQTLGGIDPKAGDLDAKLAAWEQGRDGEPVRELSTDHPEDEKQNILTNIGRNKDLFQRSRARIAVDAKLYPDEEDVTEISQAQLTTLVAMLDKARALCHANKFPHAEAMRGDALQLWQQFVASRNFVLPDLPEEAVDEGARVQKRLEQAAVTIDRLWGMGGDPAPFRTRLDALRSEADRIATQTPPDYRDLLADIDTLDRDLTNALRAVPAQSDKDRNAKSGAAKTASDIASSLLDLYRTEQISESELHGIHPNDLLVVTGPNGEKEYHRIRLRDDDTVQRRDDKGIPREAIDALRQQMQMLEVMKDAEGAGCGDAIGDATAKAEEMREAIANGAPFYKRVDKALRDFDKTIESKKLKEWHISGVEDLKARKQKFEESYAASLLPEAAAIRAEALLEEAEQKKDATGALETKYKDVDSLLDKIEKQISAKPKKDDDVGKVLANLIKKGLPKIKTDSLSVSQMTEAMKLEREIGEAIDKIKELGQHGTGLQGELRTELEAARKTLGTKSEDGVHKAKLEEIRIRSKLDTMKSELAVKPGTDPMLFLQRMHALTSSVATACKEEADLKASINDRKEEAKQALADAKSQLDDAGNLSSKVEYRAVYDSLKSQYDTASKTWNKGKGDAAAAKKGFDSVKADAKELEDDLKKLTAVKTGGEKLDLLGFERALLTNIEKVAQSAKNAAGEMQALAKDNDEQANDPDVTSAVNKVMTTLALVENLSDVPNFPPGLQAEIDEAIDEDDPAQKAKKVAKIREKVLKEIRRINGRLADDPALAVYRDNPFNHGESWPQFKATLLSLETNTIKSLNPAR